MSGTSAQEYTASSATPEVEYIRGGGIGCILYTLRSGTASIKHCNSRGDVVAATDSNGSLTWQSQYEAFGGITAESGATQDRQKSNTKDRDIAGYANEGFRIRDLETDRYLSRDPLGQVDGPNEFVHVVQSPWTKFDPLGLREEEYASVEDEEISKKAAQRASNEAQSDRFRKETLPGIASFAVDSLPLAGAAKGVQETGMGVNAFTGEEENRLIAGAGVGLGMVPFGKSVGGSVLKSAFKKSDKAVAAGKQAGEVALEKTARETAETGANKVTSKNYPNPDPPMDAPRVRYDPQTDAELMRMRQGKGPTTKATHGDQNIEMHHRQQIPTSQGGVIDEVTQQQHRGAGNHTRHNQPSQLTPSQRAKEIREHNRQRGSEYVTGGEGI